MSTNATITAYDSAEKTFKSIYVHWDGDSLLPILNDRFDTNEKALELISKGSHSCIAEDGADVNYHDWRGEEIEIDISTTFDVSEHGTPYSYLMVNGKWLKFQGKELLASDMDS